MNDFPGEWKIRMIVGANNPTSLDWIGRFGGSGWILVILILLRVVRTWMDVFFGGGGRERLLFSWKNDPILRRDPMEMYRLPIMETRAEEK